MNAMQQESFEEDKYTSPPDNTLSEADSDYCRSLTLSPRSQKRLARRETKAVQCLRLFFLGVLLLTAAIVSGCVFLYTRHAERSAFEQQFENSAQEVIENFHATLDKSLSAASFMSTVITSYALENNLSFPFVTVPNFELLGSHLRTISGSHIVHYMPIIADSEREEWEDYALENRFHIDEAFVNDRDYRLWQDAEFTSGEEGIAIVEGNQTVPVPVARPQQEGDNVTILEDGTGYHPKVFGMNAGAQFDEETGAGPFMVLWQRSPINPAKQRTLNTNWAKLPILVPYIIDTLQREKKALINTASVPPNEYFKAGQEKNLRLSQYREDVEDLIDGPSTYLTYPVFDSFNQESRDVEGVLATSIYWKVLLSQLLPDKAPQGIICVVSNSFNQYFSFRIDGPQATFLGFGDKHDPQFEKYELTRDINDYFQSEAGPHNRPYTSVPFSDSVEYTIRLYPSDDTRDEFITKAPFRYTMGFIAAFLFCAILFVAFSYMVEKRQAVMMEKVMYNARRATQAERELNEFLSHEVRNPLAVAITACSFVTTALRDPQNQLLDENCNVRQDVRDDIEVVNSSLCFINDFLRSMLDTHRLSALEGAGGGNKLKISMAPTDVLRDVLQPVSAILYSKRVSAFEVLVECPPDLVVMTDCIRLKQVILNLARNATKFVEKGYIRMKTEVDPVSNQVRILVEDSGPGIPKEKRGNLFGKYQESLDMLNQGTGIGLNLSKRLMKLMNSGNIWLDENYTSSVEGCPGARFVIELNTCPLDMESTLDKIHKEVEANDADGSSSNTVNVSASLSEQPALCRTQGMLTSGDSPDLEEGQAGDTTPTSSAPASTGPLFDIKGSDVPEAASAPTSAPLFATPAPHVSKTAAVPAPPLSTPPSSSPYESTGPDLPSGLSVLFVDDDAVLRKLFVRSIRRVEPSWKIQEAACGETAIHICEEAASKSTPFDLIFMDQYMASVTKSLLGTETVQLLRDKGIKSKICGLSANDIRDTFIRAGANSFCLKPMPCTPGQLKAMLFGILEQGENTATA